MSGVFPPNALRLAPPPEQPLPEAMDVLIQADGPNDAVRVDSEDGTLSIETEDGGVIVDFAPQRNGDKPSRHGDNLAEKVAAGALGAIAEQLLLGIQTDIESRRQWLETRAKGLKLLGLELEEPGADVGSGSVAIDGLSRVRHPVLLEAVLRFNANARGELLPANGPVKVADKLRPDGSSDALAEALEEDLNFYLTTVASEYYPDTDRLLFEVGFSGCGFKKVYNCPIRRRPVSESVAAEDLIVSNAVTDLRNAPRVTHVIKMRPNVLKRMQIAGAYRDIALITPNADIQNAVEMQKSTIQGVRPSEADERDRDYTIYECYTDLDLEGFEHKDKGEKTGLGLPYRVVIEKDSRQILEIRRNWDEGDETYTAKSRFVKYPYVPGIGFYDIGLVQILGNAAMTLTAGWRETIDAGMFANFPGFIYAKQTGRQNTNEFRVSPGGGIGLETNNQPISNMIMPLPYKDISAAFATFLDSVASTAQRVGGTAEVQISEGRQDAPVGTTLALIEQATKIEGAVHKRLHAAQAEEFQLLKECFRENPEALISVAKSDRQWSAEEFIRALDDKSIVPQADPNTPSHMHRLMKAMAIKQLQMANPPMYNAKAVDERILNMIGVNDPETLFAPEQQNPMANPAVMGKAAELALKSKDLQLREKDLNFDQQHRMETLQLERDKMRHETQTEREQIASDERLAEMETLRDIISHPQGLDEAERARRTVLGQG
ncbi:MAG: hypothetical protein J0I45_16350 [Bosea sp.]|nr:hypothetical protein [Bosea sp. (in: a-proteobacteria)]